MAVGEQSSPAPRFTDVYTAGENGYHTYRIPSVIASFHRSHDLRFMHQAGTTARWRDGSVGRRPR